ncbi:MAG: tetratricopeptide repeat protein [Calditrichaceae bacterium]|nr:tetratricopeptide repeat protein [Calditrichaceae bacterium]MBN2708772.1 tetratricopeptide repeat protein [Calditrichaceae bacterium]RQV97697.1 MAG: hypothetical protein EH224_01375 [Calditrichota bacterium]
MLHKINELTLENFKIKLKLLFFYFILIIIWDCASVKLVDQPEFSENAYELYAQALNYYEARDYDKALKYVDSAIHNNANIAKFHQLKAWIHRDRVEYYDALDAYTAVLSLQSFNPDVLKEMAGIYSLQGKNLEAVQLLRKSYGQSPNRLDLLLDIAENYLVARKYELALNNVQLYSSLKKNNLDPRYDKILAVYHYHQFNYGQAVSYFNKCINRLSLNREEIILLLKSYNHLNDLDALYGLLIGPEQNKLTSGDLSMFRGIYYYKLNKYQDAEGQFNLAFKQDVPDPLIYYYYGKTLIELGENEKAIRMLKKFREEAEQPELEPRMKSDLILQDLK